ncbi:hypothetical protein SynBIOSE41_01921 [Synechococcus sp. BIOS-E4-1]|nr:hypothetical protein SynBIOSE41_01921 [Synechococcus sp. BIOS-E4-1]
MARTDVINSDGLDHQMPLNRCRGAHDRLRSVVWTHQKREV